MSSGTYNGGSGTIKPNCNWIALARPSDNTILAEFFDLRVGLRDCLLIETAFKELLNEIDKPIHNQKRTNPLGKIDQNMGKLHLLTVSTQLENGQSEYNRRENCYVVATSVAENYPEHLAFKLLETFGAYVVDPTRSKVVGQLGVANEGTLTKPLKPEMKRQVGAFQDPANYDKISATQDKLRQTQSIMTDNVQAILQNQ